MTRILSNHQKCLSRHLKVASEFQDVNVDDYQILLHSKTKKKMYKKKNRKNGNKASHLIYHCVFLATEQMQMQDVDNFIMKVLSKRIGADAKK